MSDLDPAEWIALIAGAAFTLITIYALSQAFS